MASKRANSSASTRLRQDYLRIKKDPVPYIIGAEPLPSNILEWYVLNRFPFLFLFFHSKKLLKSCFISFYI